MIVIRDVRLFVMEQYEAPPVLVCVFVQRNPPSPGRGFKSSRVNVDLFFFQTWSKLGGLRDKLAKGNLTHVAFMIVNEQDAHSRAMYWQLKRRAAEGIPVYQQSPLQDDVWDTLQGDKDDVLVYDRCGRLTFHIMLPFSFLHYPYVEAAIRATYLRDICNCTLYSNSSSNMTTLKSFEQNMTETESTNNNKQHQHQHLHQHQHHIHINNHSQNGSSLKPVNTQTTNTKKVEKHNHRHEEHLSIIQTHR
ncbi:selenoprotein Pb precursor [Silurus asotus]|uniref:Selenoprotein Pb n=1 Tax=Silurus asotus TaxID=30991 RepID=A0AAD5FHB7_SILAS|nr:selenoprotein Pb precursor [Silurus asotus]